MRNIRDKTLLHRRESLKTRNLFLQAISHFIEGNTESRRLIKPLNINALIEIPRRQLFCSNSCQTDRTNHGTGNQPHDRDNDQ